MTVLLTLTEDRFINEIQQDFTTAFPFLKLQFFKPGAVRKKRQPATSLLDGNITLQAAGLTASKEGTMEIKDSVTVQELENAFYNQFGLNAQVFRKSGNLWLETTMTDYRTLKDQNEHGEESAAGRKTPPSKYDYELDRDADH